MKKLYFILSTFLLFTTITLHAQNDSIYFWKTGKLILKQSIKAYDLDSITFKRPEVIMPTIPSVTICNQVWSTKNLDVSTYSDGTPIPQVTDPTQWSNLTTGAWCFYNNDPTNGAVYGKLYNWYAVAGIYDAASLTNAALRKKLSPDGWHVPTYTEWTTLTDCLGGILEASGKMKEVGTTHWNSPNTGATNSSGLNVLPGGSNYIGSFLDFGKGGYIWYITEFDDSKAWYSYFLYNSTQLKIFNISKKNCSSVRLIKD